MAYFAKAGYFTLNTSNGSQAVTGVGGQGKIGLFINAARDIDTIGADLQLNIGGAESNAEQGAIRTNSEDAQGTSDCSFGVWDNECVSAQEHGTGTDLYYGDFTSWGADGFTIGLDSAPASAWEQPYLVLGGTDLTNVDFGVIQSPASAGDQAYTGWGFQPDAMIIWSCGRDELNTQYGADSMLGFGMTSGASAQGTVAVWSGDALADSNTKRYQVTSKCIALIGSGGVIEEASLKSFDADGATLTWSTASADQNYYFYIALKGGAYKVGNFVSQTSTGNFSETTTGVLPVGGIFASFCNAASASVLDHTEISLGLASSSSSRVCIGGTDEDNQATTDADGWMYSDTIYRNYDYARALEGSIDLVSWNSGSITMNQVDADPSANQILYMVFGTAVTGPTGVKTVNDLAIGSVKTINDLAIGSVKTIGG